MTPTHKQLWQWFTPRTMQRLWAKIEAHGESGCWLWTSATKDGYPIVYVTIDGKRIAFSVHRLMMVLSSAKDIPDELVVRHITCRNRVCCNPAHLALGSDGDNVQDTWNDAAVSRGGKKRRRSWVRGDIEAIATRATAPIYGPPGEA